MWTVVEIPLAAPHSPTIDGTPLRHLVEDGDDETWCGLPADAGRTIRRSWDQAASHCPACDQAQGI